MHRPSVLRFGRVEWRPAERRLLVDGRPAAVGARAIDLLTVLVEHRDRVLGKSELMDLVWPGQVVEENNLQVQVSALRRVLGPDTIATVPGRGYRFTARLEPEGTASGPSSPAPPAAAIAPTGIASAAGVAAIPPADHGTPVPAAVDDVPSAPRRPGRRLAATATLVGLLVVAALAWWARPWAEPAPAGLELPITVAVLPFTAAASAPEETALAQALTRSLTTALARWPYGSVAAAQAVRSRVGSASGPVAIGRDLGVRYLVEGQVARQGSALAVTLGIVDTTSARQVFGAERQFADADDAAVRSFLQSWLARRVRAGLGRAFNRDALTRSPVTPIEHVVQGAAAWGRDQNDGWRAARTHFDRALRIDPGHVPALVAKGWTLDREITTATADPDPARVSELDALSLRAVELGPRDDQAWALRSWSLIHQQRRGEALAAVDVAIELAPYDPNLIAQRANLVALTGRQAEAEAMLLQAIAMEPPGDAFMLRTLCGVRLLMGRYDDAAADCERAATRQGQDWFEDQMLLTAIHAQRGDLSRAAVARAAMLKQQPGATVANNVYLRLSNDPLFRRQVDEHLLAGLRKAGIPER